ncbi:MAG: hypothetical protein EHM40_13370 [Chloroflexi bacterium]|nr:MAG: hypothetical protein EHM40_13370 [Chloroflexota bacterium]
MAPNTDLSQTLHAWTRRLRLQRALAWSSRGFLLGLALSLGLGLLGAYRARLLQAEFLLLVISISLLVPILSGLTAFFWPIQPLKAARTFDLLFHLKERLSTAFELVQHSEHVPAEIIDRQLQDTLSASAKVNLRREFPLRYNLREGAVALLLVVLIGAVWFRGESWFKAAQRARDVEQAVAGQSTQIEEIIKQIEANEELSEAQKEALTSPLKEAQESLQDNPSLESSVSVLTSTGEKLQALSDPQSQQMSEALKETGDQLAGQEGSPLQSVGEDLAQGNNVSAASELKNIDVGELSPAEQGQLADQLEAMADSLQSTNPGLAEQLQQAADALRSGDTESAQQALDSAAQSLARAGQQITSSETARETASQLQEGAGEVLAAGGGQQQANQGGQGDQPSQGSSQSQADGSGGSGSGKGTSEGSDQTGDEAGSSPIPQDNGPGDGGETSYEEIYAPSLLGGEDGPQVGLPSSGEEDGEVIGQGPTTPGDPGQSLVPYSDVYSQYEEINNQAIENNEVPQQFTEIIRNYFDSLKP